MLKALGYLDRRQWALAIVAVVFIVVQVWLDLTLPEYMARITTLVETPGSDVYAIIEQGLWMLGCALGSVVCSVIVGYLAAVVAAGLARTLRGEVYDAVSEYSEAEMNRFSTSSLITRTTNDITQVQTIISMGLQSIIKAPILAVWAILKISGKNWEWTVATGVAVLALMAMLTVMITVAVPRFRRIQSLTDNINRIIGEQLAGIRVVRAFNAEEYQERKFGAANDELTNTNRVAYRVMSLMSPGMTLINSVLTLAVYWLGASIIQSADSDDRLPLFGDMVVFSSYAMQVIMAFMLLNMIFILLPRAQVSARRVMEVVDTQVAVQDGAGASPGNYGTIEFDDVSFRYPGAGSYQLKRVSFRAEAGQTIGIVGATGSGKSTLVNLIPRFYDASAGRVLVDGVDVREYELDELRRRIGYVSQKAVLFEGTIRSNLTLGDNAPSDDEMWRALGAAQADFVHDLPGGLDARVDQGGANFSGGQKQRLSIARALVGGASTFIFDDSFSALDYRTDQALRRALDDSFAGATRLVVAQRVGTIRNADRILVLEDGQLVGDGTHDELLATCPTYAEIATSQSTKAAT